MKKVLTFMLLATSLSVFANRESGGRGGSASVFLNFTSPGNGIDYETFNLAEQLYKKADQEGFVKKYTLERWGREGEVTVCIEFRGGAFDGVGPSRAFIKSIAPSIVKDKLDQGLQRTAVFVGFSCEKINEATEQDITAHLN